MEQRTNICLVCLNIIGALQNFCENNTKKKPIVGKYLILVNIETVLKMNLVVASYLNLWINKTNRI